MDESWGTFLYKDCDHKAMFAEIMDIDDRDKDPTFGLLMNLHIYCLNSRIVGTSLRSWGNNLLLKSLIKQFPTPSDLKDHLKETKDPDATFWPDIKDKAIENMKEDSLYHDDRQMIMLCFTLTCTDDYKALYNGPTVPIVAQHCKNRVQEVLEKVTLDKCIETWVKGFAKYDKKVKK